MELVKIAVMGLEDAKHFKNECKKSGVEIILNHDEKTCGRGCSVTVELHAYERDLEIVQNIYNEKYKKMLEGLEVDFEQVNSVYNTEDEFAICPACGFKFSTSSGVCPDCGLVLV